MVISNSKLLVITIPGNGKYTREIDICEGLMHWILLVLFWMHQEDDHWVGKTIDKLKIGNVPTVNDKPHTDTYCILL